MTGVTALPTGATQEGGRGAGGGVPGKENIYPGGKCSSTVDSLDSPPVGPMSQESPHSGQIISLATQAPKSEERGQLGGWWKENKNRPNQTILNLCTR